MTAVEAVVNTVAVALVESVAYVTTRLLGRTFNLEKGRAKRIVENSFFVLLAGFFVLLAVMGVGT